MDIKYTRRLTAGEFNSLRASAGWAQIERGPARRGLRHSALNICARHGKKAVGMARVITDYGYVAYIADVIVLPEYQGKGIGGEIMRRVMAYIKDRTAPGQCMYIALMAAEGKEGFYERFGFKKRPAGNLGCGMTLWYEKEREGVYE